MPRAGRREIVAFVLFATILIAVGLLLQRLSQQVTPPPFRRKPAPQGLADGEQPATHKLPPINVMISSDSGTVMGVPTLIQSILSQSKEPERIMFYIALTNDEELLRIYRWINLAFHEFDMSQFIIRVFPAEWVANKVKIRGRRKELASPVRSMLSTCPDCKSCVLPHVAIRSLQMHFCQNRPTMLASMS